MNARRIVVWCIGALVLFAILSQPAQSSEFVGNIADLGKNGANNAATFITGAFNHIIG